MKTLYIKFFALLLIVCFANIKPSKAQDPRFSQFYASPLNLNPAMTGVFEGSWRAAINYRDQWSSVLQTNPFRTISASWDYRVHILKGDYMGIGVNVLRDDQAGSGKYSQTRGHLSASYLKKLGGNKYAQNDQYLIAGAQLGLGQNEVSLGRLWFSRQFDEAAGFPNLEASNGEPGFTGNMQSATYLDFNAGLMYYALLGRDASVFVGGAINHLNSPNISMLGGRDILFQRWVGHAGGEFPFNSELSLLPAIAVMGQGTALSTELGANFRYSNHDWRELAVRIGTWYHIVRQLDQGTLGDALTFSAILEVNSWNLGLSYDINVSSLSRATNGRGAFEVSMIYTQPAKWKYSVKCPKF